MVDLKASNKKLVDRSVRIIRTVTAVDEETAADYLRHASMNCKVAVMMIKSGLEREEAERALEACDGRLKAALRMSAAK
ncbi:N-acetylmuramic acid 6-phosphate etherase [compost metagenome]